MFIYVQKLSQGTIKVKLNSFVITVIVITESDCMLLVESTNIITFRIHRRTENTEKKKLTLFNHWKPRSFVVFNSEITLCY